MCVFLKRIRVLHRDITVCTAIFNRGSLIAFLISVLRRPTKYERHKLLCIHSAFNGFSQNKISLDGPFLAFHSSGSNWWVGFVETATAGAVMLIKRDELRNLEITPAGHRRSAPRGNPSNFR